MDEVHTKLAAQMMKANKAKGYGGIQALKSDHSNYVRQMKSGDEFECTVTRGHLPLRLGWHMSQGQAFSSNSLSLWLELRLPLAHRRIYPCLGNVERLARQFWYDDGRWMAKSWNEAIPVRCFSKSEPPAAGSYELLGRLA